MQFRTPSPSHAETCQIDLCAGKGAEPVGEPYDLLRWDRMQALQRIGLVVVAHDVARLVRMTPAGCREAERILRHG